MSSLEQQLAARLTGRYDIEREIGAGGMATVFLATDVKHQRRVAVKVLKPELGAVLGAERFLSEIRVTANLQHPNLLPLFDSGEADGLLYYVMPFVDGESLRAKLDRERQLRIDEAVHIATAVASALEYAHAHGVIHRDLKPENILLHAGEPVIADFGIALAVTNAGGARITQTGLSLGTPQYMSPEQATGDRAIDNRTDIYSLGAVTFEMLTGQPPHIGTTVQAIVARVLTERPQDVRTLRPAVPPPVAEAVAIALEKLPADRWSTGKEFSEALHGRSTRPSTVAAHATGVRDTTIPWRHPIVATLATIAALSIAAATMLFLRYRADTSASMQFVVRTKGAEVLEFGGSGPLAISPDGRTLLYTVGEGPKSQLYVRALHDVRARPLPGTEGAYAGVFSPDGASIVFATRSGVMRVPATGGPPSEISAAANAGRLSWSDDRTLVLSLNRRIAKLSMGGGSPVTISTPDTSRGEIAQMHPLALGDGRTIVYASIPSGGLAKSRLAFTTIDGAKQEVSTVDAFKPVGVVDDYLVFATWYGPLKAVRFNAQTRKFIGTPVTVATDVIQYGAAIPVALSPNGTLAYAAGSRVRELDWVDEHGLVQPAIPERRIYDLPRLSPDGKRLATVINSNGAPEPGTVTGGYWEYEFSTGALSPLTRDTTAYYGVWAPNGRDFYYTSLEKDRSVWRQTVHEVEPPTRLFADSGFRYFTISPDGKSMIWWRSPSRAVSGPRFFLRATGVDTLSHPLSGLPDDAISLRISPDGRWIAYQSWESNAEQVFVRPLLGTGPRVQVSTTSGMEPVWSGDGKRLFYRDQTGHEMYAADVRTTPTFVVSARRKLFEGPFDFEWDFADYDVTADGKRFLMVRTTMDDVDILVTTKWDEIVRRRMRNGR